jgi:Flp pilus assembly protein TadG
MRFASFLRLRPFRRFAARTDGVAAIEFAFILPVMLVMLVGAAEIGEAVSIYRKITITARTVTDLATQYSTIYNTDMTNILGASSTVIAPFSSTTLIVTVSQVAIDAHGNGTISWSNSLNGTARSVGSSVTVPSSLATANSYLILGEVTYVYQPQFGYNLPGSVNLNSSIFMSPRLVNSITRANS